MGLRSRNAFVKDGMVVDRKTSQSASFGDLTQGEKIVETIADNAKVTPVSEWKICGTSVAKVGARDLVTGKHQYTSDLHVPEC